jgi:hypothetical protein
MRLLDYLLGFYLLFLEKLFILLDKLFEHLFLLFPLLFLQVLHVHHHVLYVVHVHYFIFIKFCLLYCLLNHLRLLLLGSVNRIVCRFLSKLFLTEELFLLSDLIRDDLAGQHLLVQFFVIQEFDIIWAWLMLHMMFLFRTILGRIDLRRCQRFVVKHLINFLFSNLVFLILNNLLFVRLFREKFRET